ncbi:MAG: radical SAM family heme chaperone HemW [Desulfotomaculum sp.]|nr:radical SAM family heme chaperone HemW [Desulfotomaculum sp.]
MQIGLYIHVPFCLNKCRYCDFVSYNYNPDDARVYLEALEREMMYYSAYLANLGFKVNTVFIGGGTPTVLETGLLAKLLISARSYFCWSEETEVTMEANPGTINKHKLRTIRELGVNRLSIGIQACQEKLLQTLGRVHDYQLALEGIYAAREAGFKNLNVDLIFGIPGQSLNQWRESLYKIENLQPEHLACYSLQLEEGTPLWVAVESGELDPVSEEMELEMYNEVINFLTARGYQHYEISNFAKPGFRCRHNLGYWHNYYYLGLGPAAHSHMNMERWYNIKDIKKYAVQTMKGSLPVAERHTLTKRDVMVETILMGLRLTSGLDLAGFYKRFGQKVTDVWPREINKLINRGLLELTSTNLKLTEKGLRLGNQAFVEFV